MPAGRSFILVVGLFLALPFDGFAHVIPDDVSIQIWVKPAGDRLHMLVRVPFDALADIIFPTRAGGELDLGPTTLELPKAARTWISDWVDLYEDDVLLPKPQLVESQVSLSSDNSFASYAEAWAHVTGPGLPGNVRIFPDQAMLDVLFDYPIHSERSDFAIHSRLSRLGGKVATGLRFLPAGGGLREYGYQGDPGLFNLDPKWIQAVRRFLPLGFFQIVQGPDYLLFLFCAALLFRHFRALIPFVAAFTVAHSLTLIASAYNLAPDALWFPVLFETLIALSIVYIALENIVGGTPIRYRWMIGSGFGLAFGFGFSFALRQWLQFGGSHALASILSFNAGVELGQVLLVGLFIPMIALLFRIGIPERIGTIFLAALAAHTGWHRMLDRVKWLSTFQVQWPALGVSAVWLMLVPILAILIYFGFWLLRPWMPRLRIGHRAESIR